MNVGRCDPYTHTSRTYACRFVDAVIVDSQTPICMFFETWGGRGDGLVATAGLRWARVAWLAANN